MARSSTKAPFFFLKLPKKILDAIGRLPLPPSFSPHQSLVAPVKCTLGGRILESYKLLGVAEVQVRLVDGFEVYCLDEPDADASLLARVAELLARGERPSNSIEQYFYDKVASGLGPLFPLLNDDNLEEVALDGPNERVKVFYRGGGLGWIPTNVLLDELTALLLVKQLARLAGKPLSPATPVAEGVMPEGHRVALVLGRDVSRKGPSFVVRKKARSPLSLAQLVGERVLSPLLGAYLWLAVELQGFVMIIGGMASGKTTLMQALLNMVPPACRVVTIEDTPELQLVIENWDPLVTRQVYSQSGEAKEVTLVDLTKFALRRRAEYLVIGEVRGEEARYLAQAAATGHGTLCLSKGSFVVAALKRSDRVEARLLSFGDLALAFASQGAGALALLSVDVRRRTLSWKAVEGLVAVPTDEWIVIETESGEVLKATPDHPLLVVEGGRARVRRAKQVSRGSAILAIGSKAVDAAIEEPESVGTLASGSLASERVVGVSSEILSAPQPAFDVEVAETHTFAVGPHGLVSHNCTFHAHDVKSALYRLMSEPISLKPGFVGLVWAFVQMSSVAPGVRRVSKVVEVVPHGSNSFALRRVFAYAPDADDFEPRSPAEVARRSLRLRHAFLQRGRSAEELEEELAERMELLSSLAKKGASSEDLRQVLREFYAAKRGLVAELRS